MTTKLKINFCGASSVFLEQGELYFFKMWRIEVVCTIAFLSGHIQEQLQSCYRYLSSIGLVLFKMKFALVFSGRDFL